MNFGLRDHSNDESRDFEIGPSPALVPSAVLVSGVRPYPIL